MLDDWRQRRRMIAALKEDAAVALPLLAVARAEVEAAAQELRDEFSDLSGFPPSCPRCHRSLVYQRVELSRKKWRWMWCCRGTCGYSIYDAAFQRQREASRR
jgi:hypothetical protein